MNGTNARYLIEIVVDRGGTAPRSQQHRSLSWLVLYRGAHRPSFLVDLDEDVAEVARDDPEPDNDLVVVDVGPADNKADGVLTAPDRLLYDRPNERTNSFSYIRKFSSFILLVLRRCVTRKRRVDGKKVV